MAYTARTFEAILAGILRDIRNLQPEARVSSDSDHYARSAAVAAAIEGIEQRLAWLYRQIFPDTADEDELVRSAALRGVQRKDPVAATGPVALTGTPGVELLTGASMTHLTSGATFSALTSVTVGADGTALATVKAVTTGTALNGLTGALVLTSPPLGMDAGAAFTEPTTGGEDQEGIQSLLGRLLDILQNPPAGGADYDYKRWAKEVDGVADALVLPKRRGGGTVDIAITGTSGIPSAEVIATCQAHILEQCSVYGDVWVFAPVERIVDSVAQVELADGYQLADVQVAAQAAYDALLGILEPTQRLKRSQIEAMISNLAGVTDRAVLTPTGNVSATDDPVAIGWIRPGAIALELMP